MPNITTSIQTALNMIVNRPSDLTDDTLARRNLVRPHNTHDIINTQNTIFCDNIQQRHPAKECLRKINQVGNPMVFCICPPGCKLKALMSMYGVIADSIGIIFRVRTVGNHKDLNILIQTATSPKRLTLIPVNLQICSFQRNAPALQLYMNNRQAVAQNCHIITIGMQAAIDLILIDDLKPIVMQILLINQPNIHRLAAVQIQTDNATGKTSATILQPAGLLNNAVAGLTDFIKQQS